MQIIGNEVLIFMTIIGNEVLIFMTIIGNEVLIFMTIIGNEVLIFMTIIGNEVLIFMTIIGNGVLFYSNCGLSPYKTFFKYFKQITDSKMVCLPVLRRGLTGAEVWHIFSAGVRC